ncbi:MAG: phosphatidate cytidylyltransferase [Butyrivibrio sp.]|nr:phosphatidate cytidylyltransferase [Butyrivibrio sp.]
MKTRVISGVIIAISLLVVLLAGGYIMAGVLFVLSCIAYNELSKACGVHTKDKKINILEMMGYLGIALHYILMVIYGDSKYFIISVMFTFLAVMSAYVFSFPKYKASQAISAVFCFVYAPVMLSFIYMLRIADGYGPYICWIPFVAWICDTFAYLAGRAFGKHKLAPVLSPKKTIEGSIGGMVASVITGAVFGYILSTFKVHNNTIIPAFMLITFAASIVAQIGDLAASGIKRDHDIKDYGNIIPGHGGIMDRFDSVIFVAPMIYALAALLLK